MFGHFGIVKYLVEEVSGLNYKHNIKAFMWANAWILASQFDHDEINKYLRYILGLTLGG